MDVLYYVLLIAVLALGWFVNILGLPGLWLMIVAYLGYAFATGWDVYAGWPSTIALILLAGLAEVFEFFAGAAGSAAAGGRKRAVVGAIIGGFLGGIVGTPLLPIIGTIVGACAGAFLGAAVMELNDKGLSQSMRIGMGAAKGRFWGTMGKLGVGLVMFFVAAAAALPY
jgi:uncharacterized protein YqgC (DUF456 family)